MTDSEMAAAVVQGLRGVKRSEYALTCTDCAETINERRDARSAGKCHSCHRDDVFFACQSLCIPCATQLNACLDCMLQFTE